MMRRWQKGALGGVVLVRFGRAAPSKRGASAYRELPGNTVILANTALEILAGEISPPHTALWATVERDPECLVCGGHAPREQSSSLSLDELRAATGLVQTDTEPDDAPVRREDAAQ